MKHYITLCGELVTEGKIKEDKRQDEEEGVTIYRMTFRKKESTGN